MAAQIIRQAIGAREGELAERVQEALVAHVTGLLPLREAPHVTDFLAEVVGAPFDDRERLLLRAARGDAKAMADQVGLAFEAIARAWSVRRPLLLLLEDLHWGDDASIKLIDGALRGLALSPLFVLALARPEVHERFPMLFRDRDLGEIRLPPLSRPALTGLVEEVLDERGPGQVERIVERSEGNAFHLEELVRAVTDRRSDLSQRGTSAETILTLAQGRLERLDPSARNVLQAASVFGDVFWLEGVAAVVGKETRAVDPVVEVLVAHEAIVASEAPRLAGVREFAFRHTLLRSAAYAGLNQEQCALYHRCAAQWLLQLGEDDELVALHWLEGGDRPRAAEGFARAAAVRLSGAHPEAAARCAVRALLVEGATPGVEALAVRIRLLVTALKATRRISEADVIAGIERHVPHETTESGPHTLVRAALGRALASLSAIDAGNARPRIIADAARAMAALSDFGECKRLIEEATAAAGDDEMLLRPVRWASAHAAFRQGEYGAVWDLLSQTVLPEATDERLEMLLMLATSLVSAYGAEALQRGIAFVDRAEALLWSPLTADEDPVARVRCAQARSSCFYFAGEYLKGAEASAEAAMLGRRAGLRFDECADLHNLAEQRLRLDDRVGARSALDDSDAVATDSASTIVLHVNAILRAYLDNRDDDLTRLAQQAANANDPLREFHARYWLGRLLASHGALDARTVLERAVDLARALGMRTMTEECARARDRLA